MNCARLQLQERSRNQKSKYNKHQQVNANSRSRRYCQKRMVDPQHDEDPRWTYPMQRFHCNLYEETEVDENLKPQRLYSDLCLTVQNIQFQGDVERLQRPRTSFKYKTLHDAQKHRMFVKQPVASCTDLEEDSNSQLSYYYFDYIKDVVNVAPSRPCSSKLRGESKYRETATQVDIPNNLKKPQKVESKPPASVGDIENKVSEVNKDTTVRYQKSGKRKILTISRTQSPETVQVIRVDVVCHGGSGSDSGSGSGSDLTVTPHLPDERLQQLTLKPNFFANKYLLTHNMKTLDQLSGGAKVTLFCKTFRMADRSKLKKSGRTQ